MYGFSFQFIISITDRAGIPRSRTGLGTTKKKTSTHHRLKMYFIPSQRWMAFGNLHSIRHIADDQLGFVLHTITGFHRPSFTYYYGFICHLTPTLSLAFTLTQRFRHLPGCGARLPQLLHWLPVNNATLKHSLGLTEYWASRYFARLPT